MSVNLSHTPKLTVWRAGIRPLFGLFCPNNGLESLKIVIFDPVNLKILCDTIPVL